MSETKRQRVKIPHTYDLVQPIVLEDKAGKEVGRISKVTFLRRARLKDLRAVNGRDSYDILSIALKALTDFPHAHIEELDADDVEQLSQLLVPFFQAEDAPSAALSEGANATA